MGRKRKKGWLRSYYITSNGVWPRWKQDCDSGNEKRGAESVEVVQEAVQDWATMDRLWKGERCAGWPRDTRPEGLAEQKLERQT